MARYRIEELLRVLDRSFEGSNHSLINNLASVTQAEWEACPEGVERSIRELVHHIGMYKYMYADLGFRDGTMNYSEPPATPAEERLASPGAGIEWLREAQTSLRSAIQMLADDAELLAGRKAHWGGLVPTLLLIDTMHSHDVYHAGQINHARTMLKNLNRMESPVQS